MKAKTAPKRQGPALRSGPGESATFQLPTPDAWAVLVRGLQLTPQQKHDLDLALRHVDADLKTFRAKFAGRKPRPELVRRLKRMATIMGHLEDEIHRSRQTMADFLPLDTLEAIGRLMSFSAMEAALAKELPNHSLKEKIEDLVATDPDIRIARIEQSIEYERQRQALGLEQGPELFAYLINQINKPIKTWLELDRRNRGGRPSNLVRDCLLIQLAKAAPAILGSRATATAKGKFARLCAAVFSACEVDTEGLEKAIERILKKYVTARSRTRNAKPSSDSGRTDLRG